MTNAHSVEGRTPLDFLDELDKFNYRFNEPTGHFAKYVGMGMMVLDSNWKLSFLIRGMKGQLLIHDSKVITESIEELPWAEAEIFKAYLHLPLPLVLAPR